MQVVRDGFEAGGWSVSRSQGFYGVASLPSVRPPAEAERGEAGEVERAGAGGHFGVHALQAAASRFASAPQPSSEVGDPALGHRPGGTVVGLPVQAALLGLACCELQDLNTPTGCSLPMYQPTTVPFASARSVMTVRPRLDTPSSSSMSQRRRGAS